MTRKTASEPSEHLLAVSLDEAARRLGLGHGTVRKLIRCGDLRAVRLGRQWRVPLSAIAELLGEPSAPPHDATPPPGLPSASSESSLEHADRVLAAPAPDQEPGRGARATRR